MKTPRVSSIHKPSWLRAHPSPRRAPPSRTCDAPPSRQDESPPRSRPRTNKGERTRQRAHEQRELTHGSKESIRSGYRSRDHRKLGRSRWYAGRKEFGKSPPARTSRSATSSSARNTGTSRRPSRSMESRAHDRSGERVYLTRRVRACCSGRKGVRTSMKLKRRTSKSITKHESSSLTIRDIKRPELWMPDSRVGRVGIAEALQKRAWRSGKRRSRRTIQATMQAGAKGVKVELATVASVVRRNGAYARRRATDAFRSQTLAEPMWTTESRFEARTTYGDDRNQSLDLQAATSSAVKRSTTALLRALVDAWSSGRVSRVARNQDAVRPRLGVKSCLMMPKRVKWRKQQRGKIKRQCFARQSRRVR